MHTKRIALLGASLMLVLAFLSACNYPGGTPEAECEASSLIAPGIPIEASQISDSLRPTVEWVYDGGCEPDGFRIEFAPRGDFGSPQAVVGSTNAATRTWTPGADLLPVSRYGWRVAAVNGSTIGPYSITRPLWTGPVCDGPYLRAPYQSSPATGALVTNPSPELRWDSREEGCLVANYKFEVSTDPLFSASLISGTSGPDETFDTQVDYLVDCQTYFWRVAATAGMDIVGEYATDFFTTQFGDSCEGQIEPATVSGTLWSDVCPAYGACSGVLPAGCQCLEGNLAGDGVRQDGEQGIPGVTVHAQTGECPQASFSGELSPVTDANGNFTQTLPPGIYCYTIREAMPYNDALEKPGWWTLPVPYDSPPFGYTVRVVGGDEQTGIDFAWQVAPPGSVQGGVGGELWSDLDADGVLDANEPGIGGVEIWLSSGVCDPAWSNRHGGVDPTTRTDPDGAYGFGSNDPEEWMSLPDGDYCVVVDPNDGYFNEIMGDGAWTYPVPDAEIAMTTVHMRSGVNHTDVDFGWGQPIGVAGGLGFTAKQNLYCRSGPATLYDVVGDLVPGESSAILGRNSRSTWVQIQNLDRAGTCWVALSGGTVAGDLGTAAVIADPPTPTPKPVPTDNQAPTVQVSHAEGPSCGQVIYTATASDNVGVTRIKIYLDGELVQTCSDTTSCTFTGGAGSYYATAEDAAHNIATSETKTAPAEYC